MTHGTAIVASAVRDDEICQEAATAGAAENRALRRRDDFATEVGKGAAKSAAGIRYVGPTQRRGRRNRSQTRASR